MASRTSLKNQDDIAQHLERLRADILALSETVTRLASEGASSAKSRVNEAASGAARKASDAGQQIYRDAATLGNDAIDTAQASAGQFEAQIARNPIMAVLAALGVGFAIDLLTRHR